jgi:hypothetical protein
VVWNVLFRSLGGLTRFGSCGDGASRGGSGLVGSVGSGVGESGLCNPTHDDETVMNGAPDFVEVGGWCWG